MANLITIDQLLESVDLDFEPRFVTKDESGAIYIWADKPEIEQNIWDAPFEICGTGFGSIKLTEFHNKKWQKCIYEVPQKTTTDSKKELVGKIEKLPEFDRTEASIFHAERLYSVVNELVDAVNELKGNQ